MSDTSTFNTEDKVGYNELAPSLQAKLDNAVTNTDYDTLEAEIKSLISQIGSIRTSITSTPSSISNLQINKELIIDTHNNTVKTYTSSGLVSMHAVYA